MGGEEDQMSILVEIYAIRDTSSSQPAREADIDSWVLLQATRAMFVYSCLAPIQMFLERELKSGVG